MKAAAGDVVRIFYDGARGLEERDFLRTTTGRLYWIVGLRRQERGKHVGRLHLRCLVMDPDVELGAGARVHPLFWYRRRPRVAAAARVVPPGTK